MDLGAKNGKFSYYRFLSVSENTKITYTDLSPQSESVLQVDLEKTIPVPDSSQEFLLMMNVLEHLFNYRTCIAECYRILKQQGKLIGVVPFLVRVHPDPDDHFRFTKSTLERIFYDAGFKKVTVEPLGYGPLTAGVSQFAPILKMKILAFMVSALAIGLDRLLNKIFATHPGVMAANFPLAYFFLAVK